MTALDVIALLLGVTEPDPFHVDGEWLCQQIHEHPTGSVWIARSVEDRGRVVSEAVYWNMIDSGRPRFQAYWQFPNVSARRPAAQSLRGEISLSRSPLAPVQIRLVVDGKVQSSTAPAGTDLRHHSGKVALSFYYGGPGSFPDIRGKKSLSFVAVEDGGGELGSLTVALPRWKLVDLQVDRARSDLAAAARDGKAPCERHEDPPLHPRGY